MGSKGHGCDTGGNRLATHHQIKGSAVFGEGARDIAHGNRRTHGRAKPARGYFANYRAIRARNGGMATRRLAACLRDLDYFLRYASYALIADDLQILDERVLNGLDDTYKSLGVPTGPTVRGIALLAEEVVQKLLATGLADPASVNAVVRPPFDHLCRGLAATNVRAR